MEPKVVIVQPPLVDDGCAHTYPALHYLGQSVEAAGRECLRVNLNAAFIHRMKSICARSLLRLDVSENELSAGTLQNRHYLYWACFLRDLVSELGRRLLIDNFGHATIDGKYCIDDLFSHVWDPFRDSLLIQVPVEPPLDQWLAAPEMVRHPFSSFLPDEVAAWHLRPGDIVALTTPFHSTLGFALHVLKQVKQECPGARTVLGGPLFSVLPRLHLSRLLRSTFVDMVVVGEGEQVLRDLACDGNTVGLRNSADAAVLPGGTLLTSRRVDLKTLPSVLYPVESFGEIGVVQSRGCYWARCAYCTYHQLYPGSCYRERPVSSVVEEIAANARGGCERVMLCCDALAPRYARKLAGALIRARVDVHWRCFVRADRFDAAMLSAMQESGARDLVVGLETVNHRLLNLVSKGIHSEGVRDFFAAARTAELRLAVNVIPDLPTCTIAEAVQTLDFLRSFLDVISSLNVSRFVVPRISDVALQPEIYGVELLQTTDQVLEDTIAWPYRRTRGSTSEELRAIVDEYDSLAKEVRGRESLRREASEATDGGERFTRPGPKYVSDDESPLSSSAQVSFLFRSQRYVIRRGAVR